MWPQLWPQLFLISTLVLTAYASPQPRQERRSALIRCDSFVRIIFPDQYPDCSCTYSEWSEWTPIPDSTISVSSSQCPSGEAYQDIRQRTATIERCPTPVENETQWMCELLLPCYLAMISICIYTCMCSEHCNTSLLLRRFA